MVHPCFSVDPIPFDGRAHILTSEEIKNPNPASNLENVVRIMLIWLPR